ncbi:Outer membrane receptor proteins, mostly Fe transport [Capnocytophaga haemolytica]|uniref:Colicin I receptor n=1 Tax=Capnocytophaga haemolytica TaxID=45243 RepID=A0AAX2H1Y9_9FLAO|nr:TonB-dependent receptor [Capnocytophaga haemolytica]AMD85963.1 energy transducer TonB [Capnocytophaga haemolytica]SFO34772.1 Outer membrane receptor proteins, mostly Fe transport [Capnocytophaga haemolytica]SNV15089.1 Colicin I receptor precursor [Capnocytophaga haemolytica]
MLNKTFLLLLLFSLSISAQNTAELIGTVTDKVTHQPLIGADVYIKELNKGVSTDARGQYRLAHLPEGNYIVWFSFLGYQTFGKKISVKGQVRSDVSLKEQAEEISGVTVSGKSVAHQKKEQSMPVTVIDMSNLRGTVSSVQDILLKTVGITLRTSGGVGSSSRISVRGLEGKRIGFFIDELPLGEQTDYIDINDIPIDMIDRIEIYKGVVPARFGGSSLGGAINIVIREYPDKYADLSYGYESYNTHKAQGVFKRNLKQRGLVFGIGGGYTSSDNNYTFDSPFQEGLRITRNHDKYRKLIIGGSFKAKKWWFDEVELEPVFVKTYKEIQGIEYDIREAHSQSLMTGLSNKLEKDNFLTEGLNLDMFNGLVLTKMNFIDKATRRYEWDGSSYPTPSRYGGEAGYNYPSDSDDKKLTFINKTNLEYILTERHSLNINSVFSMANGTPKDDLKTLSLGKQVNFDSQMRSWISGLTYDFRTLNDVFLNSLTVRHYMYTMHTQMAPLFVPGKYDVDVSKSDFGVNNAMRYRFLPSLMGKLSAGYEVRIPSETELLGDGIAVIPSPDLLPERNLSANLGLLFDLTGKHPTNAQIEMNFFYMYLQDMIRYTAGLIGAQYQNFGEMRTLGVEFEAKADVLPSLYLYGNTTYQDLRDTRAYEPESTVPNPTKNKRMPNIPYLMANAGLEFHRENLFGGTGQNTRLFADVAFVEEYYYDFEMTQLQKRRIPRSTTIDIGFEHSFLNNKVFLSGKVRNITNEKTLSEFNRPLMGINGGVKLRVIF